jgi:hypothetical protein
MHSHCLLLPLSCFLVNGLMVSAASPPGVQRIDLQLTNAPVAAIIEVLHSRACAAVSFIAASPDDKATVYAQGASVVEVLADIARSNPGYRAETIGGRSVLYPVVPEFQTVIDRIDIQSKPRQEALDEYVDVLRKRVLAFATLGPQPMIGNERHPLYSDPVSLRPKGRVIEHLVDLLGQDQALYFEFTRAYTGVPVVSFSRVHCAADAQ